MHRKAKCDEHTRVCTEIDSSILYFTSHPRALTSLTDIDLIEK